MATSAGEEASSSKYRAVEEAQHGEDAPGVSRIRVLAETGNAALVNPFFMRYYYLNLFPFRTMHKWLAYGNGEYCGLRGLVR